MPGIAPTLRGVFASMDRDQSGTISSGEVDQHLADIGMTPGLVRNMAHDQFTDRMDTGTVDGDIEWSEFVDNAGELMPREVRDSSGRVDPSRVDAAFDLIAGPGASVATRPQIEDYVRGQIPFLMRAFASSLVAIGAESVMRVMDPQGTGTVARADMQALADDIAREQSPPTVG
jgi:hypothetical protein